MYRLPGGTKSAEAVTVRIGITDGITSEVVRGLAEGDLVVTGVATPGADAPAAGRPASNPFSGGRRF